MDNQLNPEIIRQSKAHHAANRRRIEAKDRWSQQDFEDMFFTLMEVPDNAKSLDEAVFSIKNIEVLAFDPRTPQKEAEKLLDFLKSAKAAGMPD